MSILNHKVKKLFNGNNILYNCRYFVFFIYKIIPKPYIDIKAKVSLESKTLCRIQKKYQLKIQIILEMETYCFIEQDLFN